MLVEYAGAITISIPKISSIFLAPQALCWSRCCK